MTREAAIVIVAALTTIRDASMTPSGGIPSGHLYTALMGVTDLDTYNRVLATLKSVGYIKERGHFLTITSEGKQVAEELEAAVEGAKS